jgi:type III secretion protein V
VATGRVESLVLKVSRYNDIVLAGLIVSIIALMILPVPTFLVDLLLATNLAISVILLMMSMYINQVLAFSTFPTLLLFTTLLRLALNITSTRLILLQGYAGEVIQTFGEFVIAGEIVVGMVVFLIITIVQFLVIAKGSERVAEVAARFTLDAMPGKQMSIDADLRAGTIDMDTAKLRRTTVEKENQLYGAMDGAMKFVKGDAIAGIIITVINLLGGTAMGVLRKGMTAGDALNHYGVMTIGDGLVSQIPALLICMTAGIIVTRVSSEDSPALGGDISKQVLAQPIALIVAGVLCCLFALVPGFPKPQFLILGAVISTVGIAMKKASAKPAEEEGFAMPGSAPAGQKPSAPRKSSDGDDFSMTVPLILDVPETLEQHIKPQVLNEELIKVRRALYHDLGVPFPGIHLRYNAGMKDESYRILLQEIPVAMGQLRTGHVMIRESQENLQVLGVEFTTDKQFLPDVPTIWAAESFVPRLVQAGVHYLEAPKIVTHHLAFVLKKYAGDFLGLQETKFLLDNMEARYSEVVKEVQRVLPVPKIAEILQRLVQEEISIRNLRTILQALIEWGQKEKDPVLLVEYVRSSLKRYISYKYSGGQNMLAVYLLEPDVEETVRKAIRQTSGGSFLALDPNTTKRFVSAVKQSVGDASQSVQKPVLLSSMDVRRYIKKLIDIELPTLPVLSYQELTEEITIQPLAKVSI